MLKLFNIEKYAIIFTTALLLSYVNIEATPAELGMQNSPLPVQLQPTSSFSTQATLALNDTHSNHIEPLFAPNGIIPLFLYHSGAYMAGDLSAFITIVLLQLGLAPQIAQATLLGAGIGGIVGFPITGGVIGHGIANAVSYAAGFGVGFGATKLYERFPFQTFHLASFIIPPLG